MPYNPNSTVVVSMAELVWAQTHAVRNEPFSRNNRTWFVTSDGIVYASAAHAFDRALVKAVAEEDPSLVSVNPDGSTLRRKTTAPFPRGKF